MKPTTPQAELLPNTTTRTVECRGPELFGVMDEAKQRGEMLVSLLVEDCGHYTVTLRTGDTPPNAPQAIAATAAPGGTRTRP